MAFHMIDITTVKKGLVVCDALYERLDLVGGRSFMGPDMCKKQVGERLYKAIKILTVLFETKHDLLPHTADVVDADTKAASGFQATPKFCVRELVDPNEEEDSIFVKEVPVEPLKLMYLSLFHADLEVEVPGQSEPDMVTGVFVGAFDLARLENSTEQIYTHVLLRKMGRLSPLPQDAFGN